MRTSIEIKTYEASSAGTLASTIKTAGEERSERFLLFWGPPGASQQEVEGLLREIPEGWIAVGVSGPDAIRPLESGQGVWSAVSCASKFMTVHLGWADLDAAEEGGDIGLGARCFKDSFSPGYFEAKERTGFHGVKYERPTFLLLFLPGVSGLTGPDWPVANKDYQILKAVQKEVGAQFPIFGGSAACRWPGPNGQPWRPWLAWKQRSERFGRFMRRGIVGLVIETDLATGFGYSHGVELETPIAITRLAEDFGEAEAKDAGTVRRTRPPRFHRAKFEDRGGSPIPLFKRGPDLHPLIEPLSGEAPWKTLVTLEGQDMFVDPPYEGPEGTVEFLRPVSKGSVLYHGTASMEDLLSGPANAIKMAARDVFMLEGILLVNCMGRLALLNGVNSSEANRISTAAGNKPVFGMYVDGEICASGARLSAGYRNWTVCALAFGAEFNEQYLAAATSHLLAEVDREIGRGGALNSVLKKVVECAAILHQTEMCHIRVFSLPSRTLRLASATASGERYLRREIAVDDPRLESLIACEAFKTGKIVKVDREEYRRRDVFLLYDGDPKAIEETLRDVAWFTAIPIMVGASCWAVLNINSMDSRYSSVEPMDEKQLRWERKVDELLGELRARMAVPIMSARALDVANRAQVEILHAKSLVELSGLLERLGHDLFDQSVNLSLFLPDDPEVPKTLQWKGSIDPSLEMECALGGPEAIDKEVIAWVYEKRREVWSDSISTGQGLEPGCVYRRVRMDTQAKYSIPIPNPSNKDEKGLGVLDLEAPAGVVNVALCAPHLGLLANSCSHTIQWLVREEYKRRYLEALLPSPVSRALRTPDGLRQLPKPDRREVAILVADIRGYTEMSSIVGESKMTAFLIPYYKLLAESIAREGGTVDKFVGDGVYAMFGLEASAELGPDGELGENDRLKAVAGAVQAAFRIQEEFRKKADTELSKWRFHHASILKEYRFEIGVMVHFGTPMVGLFGGDVTGDAKKAPGHATYTMIGPDVNLAARLSGHVDGGKVFVSSTARQCLLRSPDVAVSQQPKTVSGLKGVPYNLEIFEVSLR
jgi:class 3 adenylate cyclase